MICLLALMEVEILAIFLGEIVTTAGKWMAKMRKPFASNYFKLLALLLNVSLFQMVQQQNDLCFLFFLENEYGIQIRL